MEQKLQLVDSFIDVPVTTQPSIVICSLLNLIQPHLGAGIHGALINHRQKCLYRLILKRTGMGQNHINVFPGQLLFYIGLNFFGRLLIGPPPGAE